MSNISKHIYELLFEHDCVIIPGFGGFVANYLPAHFEDSTNQIYPPSKHLLFNKNLINNDGLLAHRISAEDTVSYDVALKKLSDFSDQIKLALTNDKRYELQGIGVLFVKENSYRFKSFGNNFLMSSFGLPVLNAIPYNNLIKEESKEETPVIDLNPIKEIKKTKKLKYWWVAAALLPIVFYSAWIPLKTNLLDDKVGFHYSDLNPFSFSKDRLYHYNTLVSCVDNNLISNENISDLIIVNEDNDAYGKYNLDDNELYVTVKLKEQQVLPVIETTKVEINNNEKNTFSSNSIQNKYFLIGGCFKKKKNADNFLKKLQSLGYDALEVDVHNGLHRIAIENFSNRKQAKEVRKELSEDKGISSWILKKK